MSGGVENFDPGSPRYETARALLVEDLLRIDADAYGEMAEDLKAGELMRVPSWVVMQVIARLLPTAPPARTYAEGETETQWEVWENDLMVASSTDEADALHYLAVYSQDGPVRLVKAVTVRTPCDPLATSRSQHEGADNGSR